MFAADAALRPLKMTEMNEDQRKALEEKIKSMSPEELKEFQKKQCIFCRMVAGEIPAKKIYEDDSAFAILDINPASAGHVLLLPKEHYPILQQMPDDLVAHMGAVAKGFSQAFLQALKAEGSTIFAASGASAGQRAQHVMIHLIPRKENDGIGINPPSKPISSQDLQRVAQALKPFADQIMGVKEVSDGKQEAVQPSRVVIPKEKKDRRVPRKDDPHSEAGTSLDDIASFLAGK